MNGAAFKKKTAGIRPAMLFIVLIGVVSLFADMTYEGARSITGQFLGSLGANGAIVGFVAGFGELAGYAIRFLSGVIADRTERYWTLAVAGYVVNLFAVPLLALAGRWEIAACLMIVERIGKGIRNPVRDAMLSHAASEVGTGWGFGLHEAMDSTGATIGPLIVAAVLYEKGSYQTGFAFLLIPAVLAIAVLICSMLLYPRPKELGVSVPELQTRGLPDVYWIYLGAMALAGAGYADFPLIGYHFEKTLVVSRNWAPVFYSVAMGAAAITSLVLGRLFDRVGIRIIIVSVLLSSIFAPLVFLGGFGLSLVGMALWGLGMGAHESVMRAAVAGMAPRDRRATAYGIFNTGYGIFWFLGSFLMGALYDISIPYLVLFSMVCQFASAPLLFAVKRKSQLMR
ncbi:MAG: MFS transporter [Syntrophobacteraceae bacterium]|nr:MFS transporter [Syntrophobacteraceae bacterium]